MKKIGMFYGTNTVKTALVAKEIKEAFGDAEIDVVSVESAAGKEFEQYDNLIVGAATWFDGELPSYWDELVPELDSLVLKGKKVAVFGLGDQVNYPENFVDGIGILADFMVSSGATLVGKTSIEGYLFEQSRALRDGQFLGLAIDIENQSSQTHQRIKDWVEQLRKEFN
ncbi:Flavodoxin B [bioreactor metagenome]|uniref:Flavodoxin B n=1 Tax=bioreactor metagenome TaxID=1076179 RepID=A0A644W518_9ZZZZ|nr:flavodoxin [Macellibacteroides fermentans]